jgi:RimJ/RimL family protein N-acetyltransferase
MSFIIREAKLSDIDEVASLYAEAYKKANPKELWTYTSAKAYITYRFNSPPCLFFIGECDGELAGVIWGQIKPWWNGNKAYNLESFLQEKFRGKGYANQLNIRFFEEAIDKYHVKDLEAITFSDRPFPLEYYKRISVKEDSQFVLLEGVAEDILNKLKEHTK